ncbi:MAG: YqiA/YcfP family alpha/beta fold hydrolase [Chitinivorax sp.]
MIVYLHGFISSPQSHKATLLHDYLDRLGRGGEWLCPAIPPYPAEAAALLNDFLAPFAGDRLCLVGSSLGGYYALWLAERFGCRAVLVNPAIRPYELLQQYRGEQLNPHTGQRFSLGPQHMQQLRDLDVPAISRPQRYWLLTQTGDEVLDAQQAIAKLAGARQTVIEGGDHAFIGFENYLAAIVAFADGAAADSIGVAASQ